MDRPKILFISKLLGIGERTGGEYWMNLNLFRELEKLGLNIWLLHYHPTRKYSNKKHEIVLSSFAQRNDFWRLVHNAVIGPSILAQVKPDIVHVADESLANCAIVNPLLRNVKKVVTITDLIPIILPKNFDFQSKYTLKIFSIYATRFFDRIVTISKCAAADISKIYKTPMSKIDVVYLGIDPIFRPLPKDLCRNFVVKKYGIKTPYILYVGGTAPNRNVPRIIESYKILWKKTFKELSLVLTRLVSPIILSGNEELPIPPITRQDLPYVYGAAEALVYPSLADGFGLPPLEAMACGTPVVVSDIPIYHEILDEATLFVNPLASEEIAAGISTLLGSKSLRHELKLKGLENAKRYSWDSAAKQLVEIYYQLLADM